MGACNFVVIAHFFFSWRTHKTSVKALTEIGVLSERKSGEGTPEASNNLYEVSIADVKNFCSVEHDFIGKRWSWDMFNLGEQRPSIKIDISAWSPTLHYVIDLTYEDFKNRPIEKVKPNDEENVLGVRVELRGLKGRRDLNGAFGRCGIWLGQEQRYQVFLPSYDRGPCSVAVKPINLVVGKPCVNRGLANLVAKHSSKSPTFPNLFLSF